MAEDTTAEVDETTEQSADTDTTEVSTEEEVDWKAYARKHEREAKKARKEREELAAKLQEREAAGQSEQEKAIAKAREEAVAEVRLSADQERRGDRLELAVTKLAARTFADSDDALTNIERAMSRGDLDPDDIFDDEGKVQTDALKSALDDLLDRKPHLAARTPGPGENDAGKGAGGGPKSVHDMTVDEHLKRIQQKRTT